MKRTLSITLDGEASTILIENSDLFTLTELFGIAAHIKIKTRCETIERLNQQRAAEKELNDDAEKAEGVKEEVKG